MSAEGYAVTLRAGVADVGSGRPGLALLAAVRDDGGEGPPLAWTADLYGPAGLVDAAEIVYDAPGPGSFVAWPFFDVPVDAATQFELHLGSGPEGLTSFPFAASPPASVGIPAPRLSIDGQRVEWAAVAGAATYRCAISGGGATVETFGAATTCELAGLAPGPYVVSVQALSIDLAALGADPSRAPVLPARFDLSEGRVGVLVPEAGGTPLQLLSAGGEVRFGGVPYLAIWASITAPDGTPAPHPWALRFTRSEQPIPFSSGWNDYPANASRALLLGASYWCLATPGHYLLTAEAGAARLHVPFDVGLPAQLVTPDGVVATPAALGAATVTFTAVAGARSYLVRAFDSFGDEVASGWTASTSHAFPQGTFTSGETYDVYVLATDAALELGGAVPTQVGATETTIPATFTAP